MRLFLVVLLLTWIVGTAVLWLISFSRWAFDDEELGGPKALGRHGLVAARFGVSLFWWLMLPSPSGRRALRQILKGKANA